MYQRINYGKVAPEAVKAISTLDDYVETGELEPALQDLVRLRASQINGCVLCVDMHTRALKKHAVSERKIHSVVVWHESPFFNERERAALAWAEAVTLISEGHVPDDVYEQARQQFSEKELVDLTFLLADINAWNRIALSFRQLPDA
ncbi:carboxymuconolactone decarboxylase family protein [Dictyobacter formicarum]|uniref:Alkyl hydroperoxide reductase AhpD n=1 Tax=Dictyobacter formicarum TaxID=2778368 RepID=A0ABQ3VBS6_9CHLR|nr:carboxymuconolactone decarboxylase family protein [Dictyobacter formicarum]GHO83239.1 alkyl hydroperoxide reductase AhpD [Dictyobacter formicarum]